MTNTRSLRTINDLQPGDHLCCLYKTEEEHRAVLTPFLRQGLERGEKVLYIVDTRTADTILDYLRDDGLDVQLYLAHGQLVILTRDDAYTREGVFDPDGMIDLLRTETERALAEGYSALRVTGEMTWALRGLPGSERLMEYENRLNEFFPGNQCLAICQYDRRRFDAAALLDVLSAHPIAVIGAKVYDNFYYMPPAESVGNEAQAAQLRRWVKTLAERRQAEAALRERTRELEMRDRIALIFLTVPDDEMYADVLDVILEALASEYGVFGYIDEKGALVVPSMTRRVWDQCQVPDKDIVFPRETWGDSTWVRAIREKRSIFSNEPSTNVPEGHVPIRRHITYPIIYQGVVVGITQVANKKTDYDENDIQLLGTINGAIAPVLAARVQRDRLEKRRERAEEALGESEQRARLLMDSTGEAIYGLDLEGNCTLCNPASLRLLGYQEAGDLLGKNMHDLIHHTRPDGKPYPADECRIYRSFRHGEGTHVDDEVLWRADGTSFPAEYWSYPVKSGDEIVGSAVTFVDITERKRAEEAMRRLNKQLEEASRHKSEFLATLSHELRTPLNAILGASELLAEGLFGELNEKQVEYAGDIHESGTLLLSLINDVLDLSKVEAGKLDLHLSHFDLRSLMESSAVIVRERAAGKSLELNVIPPPEEVVVEADERKIKQIVYNLLSNAVKFTPEKGRVVFTAHQHGDEVIFAVEDTGPGIPDEFHERIFEEFFQTPGSREGTGLGLTLAKRLVELHGGRIWLESDTGQGSRFFFAIPVAHAAPTGSGDLAATQ